MSQRMCGIWLICFTDELQRDRTNLLSCTDAMRMMVEWDACHSIGSSNWRALIEELQVE